MNTQTKIPKSRKRTDELPSIRTRLLLVNLAIVLVAFVGIILVFNALMSNYISQTAASQLSRVVDNQAHPTAPNLNNVSTGRFNTRPVAFVIFSNYTIGPMPENALEQDKENAQKIAVYLKNHHLSLDDLKDYRLETGGSTFYIQSVVNSKEKNFTLFYMDITGIVSFADSINVTLLWLTLAMLTLTSLSILYVTRRMTRPLYNLAEFARRIGKGDFTPSIEIFHDRELATLADNLNDTAHQLDINDKDQKMFFQNASHELRTPLMAIKSYAEGIQYDVMLPKEASRTILKETDNMTELVEDLLTTSRLDALNVDETIKFQDLCGLLTDVANEQRPIAEQRALKLFLDLPKQPVVVQVKTKALRRAVVNLLSNAIRYAKEEVRLTLAVEKDRIKIKVTNDGPAISDKDLPHIFERFYKGNGGVHGIGLAIVKSVVEQHGGRLTVHSSERETSFMIDLKA